MSLEPGFSASRLAWLSGYRGVFAQASLRGGGEYGVEWRNAGSKENKQNVFDDFQASTSGYLKRIRVAFTHLTCAQVLFPDAYLLIHAGVR